MDEVQLLKKVIDLVENTDPNDDIYKSEILEALEQIDKKTILREISMAQMPLIIYLLHLKYDGKIKLLPLGKKDLAISVDGLSVANMSYLAVFLHIFEVKEDKIHMEGHISFPTVFTERTEFLIKNNGESIPYRMEDQGLDLSEAGHKYENRNVFVADIPLKKGMNTIEFINAVTYSKDLKTYDTGAVEELEDQAAKELMDEMECPYGKINSMRFVPVSDNIPGQYCIRGKWLLYIEGNRLICRTKDEKLTSEFEKRFEAEIKARNPKKAQWICNLRKEALQCKKKKPIWLFMDRIDRAGDNGEALFRYAREKEQIDSYFVIDEHSPDYERLLPLGNVVKLYSDEHFRLFLQADNVISSQSNGAVENPFWEDAEYFRDLYHRAKIIFLQHGVIKDDMSTVLSKFNTNFRGFVTSTYREWQSIIWYPYHYTSREVWLTGLPRFDHLYNEPKKYILIMPTWRQGLMEQVWDENKQAYVWQVKEDFLESEYVKRYISLLNNERLLKACAWRGYKLAFMPHALMAPYIEHFVSGKRCEHWGSEKSYREAFAEGNLLVTDYSSVAFDFLYLKKPVIYYQFDKEEFFAKHTYKQGFFDYEKDAPGEVIYDEEHLVDELIAYMKNKCRPKEMYLQRMENLFEHVDQDNCKRVFKKIMEAD